MYTFSINLQSLQCLLLKSSVQYFLLGVFLNSLKLKHFRLVFFDFSLSRQFSFLLSAKSVDESFVIHDGVFYWFLISIWDPA